MIKVEDIQDKNGKMFITFGTAHTHEVKNGRTGKNVVLNHLCVGVIHADSYEKGRMIAFETFGPKFCFSYFEDRFEEHEYGWATRGLIEVN